MLWTECLYPLKIHMLKPNPQCDGIRRWRLWGNWLVMRMEPSWMEFVSLWNRLGEFPHSMWGHGKKTLMYELGSRPLPDTESASALILVFRLPQLWEIHFCYFWLTQSKLFCYRGPNRFRYLEIVPFFSFLLKKMIELVFKLYFKDYILKSYNIYNNICVFFDCRNSHLPISFLHHSGRVKPF